ncbi:uncharacterized protein PgNI_03508, partial [Pyricularia grisea]|uniref:Uncharacterized protein n=1 Tax=Pyricularia grisea TaxID=148305 RepID=A0A6P8BEZ8_PYRGI
MINQSIHPPPISRPFTCRKKYRTVSFFGLGHQLPRSIIPAQEGYGTHGTINHPQAT